MGEFPKKGDMHSLNTLIQIILIRYPLKIRLKKPGKSHPVLPGDLPQLFDKGLRTAGNA